MRTVIRWLLRGSGLLLLIAVVALAGLRGAAWLRESETVETAMPDAGTLIPTTMGRVYVEERGPQTGQVLLLIHGSVGWAGFWDETLQALSDGGYRAIAMDLSPMGYSDRDSDAQYDRRNQAKRILALIEAMQIKPILIAHSFGAGPGTEALFETPEAFAGAVIVAGAIGLGSHETPRDLPVVLKPQWVREVAVSTTVTNTFALKPLLKAFMHKKDRALPEYLEILKKPYAREGTTEAIAHWLPTLLAPPTDARSTRREAYASLTLPIALIWGDKDTTTPPEQGEELHALIAGATLTLLPDLGHIPQIEDPPAFQKALISAVSGLVERDAAN